MSDTVIFVENLSKQYRLGLIGSGALRADTDRWWAKLPSTPAPVRPSAGRSYRLLDDQIVKYQQLGADAP